MVGLSVVALVALAVPLAGATQLRASHRAMSEERLEPALGHAASAGRVEPYAASPALQRALVLEAAGDLDGAVSAALRAQEQEPTNWRPPFVLARLETERGRVGAALAAYRRARSLNRESSLLR
jgi:tetratricopeptide (TPR) repeat protein